MYGALWRALPGPAWVRAILCLVLFLAVVAVLFTWVFPWIAEITDLAGSATMDTAAAAPGSQ